jgi:O-acetyl-ADP-ribose deacetylase (regulator of RNase III)
MTSHLQVILADITTLRVDAIVNAANSSLLGGGGVDGAIHRAAGPGLLAECRALNGCETGKAKLTKGHGLPALFVIHTVGPVWQGGTKGEAESLAQCYRSCFEIVREQGFTTVAFPSISTGAYGFPLKWAADIATREINEALKANPKIETVTIACFDERTLSACQSAAGVIVL